LHTAISGDGRYESERVKEKVWKFARRKRSSYTYWENECRPEVAREGRYSNLYTKSGKFVVFRNIIFQLISLCSRICYQDRGRICRILSY